MHRCVTCGQVGWIHGDLDPRSQSELHQVLVQGVEQHLRELGERETESESESERSIIVNTFDKVLPAMFNACEWNANATTELTDLSKGCIGCIKTLMKCRQLFRLKSLGLFPVKLDTLWTFLNFRVWSFSFEYGRTQLYFCILYTSTQNKTDYRPLWNKTRPRETDFWSMFIFFTNKVSVFTKKRLELVNSKLCPIPSNDHAVNGLNIIDRKEKCVFYDYRYGCVPTGCRRDAVYSRIMI